MKKRKDSLKFIFLSEIIDVRYCFYFYEVIGNKYIQGMVLRVDIECNAGIGIVLN
ncbi:hypothetical protein AGMMS49953_07340 [Endomicrobiia bacterium]|nr:hypothetical protein AGMMS49953_07340 [Endomicrobiia bacterium]